MSSADRATAGAVPPPRWPRPRRLAYVLAVVLPLLLVAILALPLGVVWGLSQLRSATLGASGPTTTGNGVADQGQPGVGDPYFPDYGSSGYDAQKYTVSIRWDADRHTLAATTTIAARATQPLTSFWFDLAVTTDRVSVDGRPATFRKTGFADVQVTPRQPIAAGASFEVTVDYSGDPSTLRRGHTSGWWTTGQEWTAAGEPESSVWWFPANDHPSDPALMDVSVRVPAGMQAVSNGRLVSADAADEPAFDTWHWVSAQPMATYLSFLTIGHYELRSGTVDGRPYVYAVSEQLPATERAKAFAGLERSGAIVRRLETMFGPYPFSELGGVVPAHKLWFAGLETQTRPVYDRGAITEDDATELVVHELSHMWFGDQVTVRRWDDIFDNEAYASWAQWGYEERTGGRSADAAFRALYERAKGRTAFWRVTMIDPGRAHLFDAVYSRGPMTLQALRTVIGDDAFFSLARDWAQQPGTRSLEEWMVLAQSTTRVNLLPFFQAWLYAPTAPEPTAANGFRR